MDIEGPAASRSRARSSTSDRFGRPWQRSSARLAFPLRVDRRGGIALASRRDRRRPGDRPDPRHRARASGRCGPSSAAASTTTCSTRSTPTTVARMEARDPRRARPLGAAHRGRRRRLRPRRRDRGELLIIDRLPRCARRTTCATSSTPSTSSRRRSPSEAPRDRARRPPLPGPRLRGAPADQPRLPGVDRAQRLRPRHHADRAVRVDDRDDDLPAQPRAGQAPRRAARAARHPPRRPERRAHRPALPARRRPPRSRSRSRRRDRGRHAAHARTRSRSSSRSTRTSRSRPLRPAAYVVAARRPGQGRRRRRRRRRARRAPTSCRSARRPRSATRSTSASRSRSARLLLQVDVDASQARGAGVEPRGPAAALGGLAGRRAAGRRPRCSRTSRAASTTAAGTVELQLPAAQRRRSRSAASALHWLRCRIDDRTRHGGAATTYSHPPEIYSITAAPIGALLPATHAAQVERRDARRSATARPARCSRCATPRCSSPSTGETLEVQDPESGDWSTLGAARGLRRLDRVRPPLRARPRHRRGRARPGDPRDRRRLDAVRRRAAEGRGAALHALPPRRRAARATSRPAR